MKQKVSDYIADFLVNNGITDMFSVVGGGAMHLNDSFGHHPGLRVTYNHHEQGSAIAAEAYARVTNKIAGVCVTSGPGATNAITGVLCGWMGSIPMLVFSGQVRVAVSVRSNNLHLRTMGEQEIDIEPIVSPICKYAKMVLKPEEIRYHLEKALYLAYHGRPGPCWLDMPLDVQGAIIDTDTLRGYDPCEDEEIFPAQVTNKVAQEVIARVRTAKRPILYLGQGVRTSGGYDTVLQMVEKLNIPVTTGMTSVDQIWNSHPLYAGRPGATGDRAGNFAVQNSDLLISVGSRLSFKQTGYNTATWAREAYKIMVDIDAAELEKPHLGIDMKIWADAKSFAEAICAVAGEEKIFAQGEWHQICKNWVNRYPVVTQEQREQKETANIYAFYEELSRQLGENEIIVTTSGSSRVVGRQALTIKPGQRVIVNHSTSPMGYCLAAAVGACVANERKPIVCCTGEGSFQMNIQELQTMAQNRLPVRIFVLNNEGYHSIRQSQSGFFGKDRLVGMGDESGDVSFPDFEKVAALYGFHYMEIHENSELTNVISKVLDMKERCLCQVFLGKEQGTMPKVSSRRLPNGQFVSAPLEDMAPFLSREELKENLIVKPLEGEL